MCCSLFTILLVFNLHNTIISLTTTTTNNKIKWNYITHTHICTHCELSYSEFRWENSCHDSFNRKKKKIKAYSSFLFFLHVFQLIPLSFLCAHFLHFRYYCWKIFFKFGHHIFFHVPKTIPYFKLFQKIKLQTHLTN